MWFKTMRREQNLVSALGIQKDDLGLTMHFSEIIKLQFGKKKPPYIALYFCVKCVVTPNFIFGFQ